MQAFQAAIDAGAGAVMCSYNRINTVYACANDTTWAGARASSGSRASSPPTGVRSTDIGPDPR